jgi:hypothetical protein
MDGLGCQTHTDLDISQYLSAGSSRRTYIKIQASAGRLDTLLDKVTRPLSNAVEGLRPDNVGVGVAVREDAFSPCMLTAPGEVRFKDS